MATECLKKMLIITPFLGAPSEVWLWRQIVGFRQFNPSVLAWQYINQDQFPVPGIEVENLDLDFNAKSSRLTRLLNRCRGLKGFNFCGPSPRERQLLCSAIREIKPDIVLCHFGYAAMRALPVVKVLQIPMVVHFHGRDISATLQNRWYRWGLHHAVKHFSAVIVVGSHQRKRLIKEFSVPEDKIHLIPCGVDTNAFCPVGTSNSTKVKFLSVGRLSPEKGIDCSLRAFFLLSKKCENCEYYIVGDGPVRVSLENLARDLSIQEQIHFLGNQNPAAVRTLINDSDIFLQHSLEWNGCAEGFGISIAEASACGLPVIATKCGGIADQISDAYNGFLVSQKDVLAMAERMLLLAQDKELRGKLGQNGRIRAVKDYDLKSQIRKLETVLVKSLQ